MDWENYAFDVWGVFPAHRTGTTMDGTVSYTWRYEFCGVARHSSRPLFKTENEARQTAEHLTAKNEPF